MIRHLRRLLRISILLKISSVLTLIGLALMVWSLAQPTPMPVILAMSLGQVLGILAFLLFGTAILIDQFRKQREQVAHEVHAEAAPSGEVPSYPAPLHGASSVPEARGAAHEAPP
ncbi:MAG TPA: hypothetical protein VF469_26870 [Kofleriaceae bacterium]